jgi:hypothetical protein
MQKFAGIFALECTMTKAAQLFDTLLHDQGFRTDAELASAIGIEPHNLSRLRHGHRPVSDGMVLRIHELSGWAIRDIKGVLGMQCHEQVPMPG